jgi:hypothetical protein
MEHLSLRAGTQKRPFGRDELEDFRGGEPVRSEYCVLGIEVGHEARRLLECGARSVAVSRTSKGGPLAEMGESELWIGVDGTAEPAQGTGHVALFEKDQAVEVV